MSFWENASCSPQERAEVEMRNILPREFWSSVTFRFRKDHGQGHREAWGRNRLADLRRKWKVSQEEVSCSDQRPWEEEKGLKTLKRSFYTWSAGLPERPPGKGTIRTGSVHPWGDARFSAPHLTHTRARMCTHMHTHHSSADQATSDSMSWFA